ncbi:MAG: hypothetical protein ACPGLV_10485 [Bacteroidia bacterium]
MGKSKPMNLTIKNPCKESWNDMIQGDGSRFCANCEEYVMGFSRMTDKEIYSYLKERQGQKVCGRIRNDQLQRPILPEFKRASGFELIKVAATIFIGATVFLPNLAEGQSPQTQVQTQDSFKNYNADNQLQRQVVIKGKVLLNDEIFPNAVLEINGRHMVFADENGEFTYEHNGEQTEFSFQLFKLGKKVGKPQTVAIEVNTANHSVEKTVELSYLIEERHLKGLFRKRAPKPQMTLGRFSGGYTL